MADEAEVPSASVATESPASGSADESIPASGSVENKGEVVAAPAAEAPAQTEDFGLDAGLMARAKEYGVKPGLLAEYGDKAPELMDAFAAAIDAKLIASEKAMQGQTQAAPKQPAIVAEGKQGIAKQQAEVKSEAPEQKRQESDYDFRYSVDVEALKEKYEDDIVAPILEVQKELNDHRRFLSYIMQTFQPTLEMKEHFDKLQGETYNAKIDQLHDVVDEKFRPLIGKGRTEDMDPNSPEYKFRAEMRDQMDLLANAYLKRGQKLSMKEVHAKALNALAADHLEKLTRDQVGREVESRKRQTLRNPNRRGSGKPEDSVSNPKDAVAEIGKLMKSTGIGDSENVDAALAELR